jgi:hypothetical protein
MGNIVMPKQSADKNEMEAVLSVFINHNDWLENSELITDLKKIIGDSLENQAYTKKAQIPAYFGLIEWENPDIKTSRKKITERGIAFYHALKSKNQDKINKEILKALEELHFGRNVHGCSTNSHVEPPKVFVKAALFLNYLTRKEYGYILWKMDLYEKSILDLMSEIKLNRLNNNYIYNDTPNKYNDAKPITILYNWGLFVSDGNVSGQEKIKLSDSLTIKDKKRLLMLEVTNNITGRNNNDNQEIHSNIYIMKKAKKNPSNLFRNRIIYGAPGTGKSYVLNKEAEQYFDSDKQARITFTPNYSFQQFIGAYKPTPIYKDIDNVNNKLYKANNKEQLEIQREPIINYSFVPGLFIEMLIQAIKHPTENYLILIEEINRVNVSSVFGAVFQLLDRNKDHVSEYAVEFNTDVTTYLISENILKYIEDARKIRMPSNLFLWSTMNNADQGVLPLDSAFKRRWSFEYIGLNKNEEDISDWIINFGQDANGKSICYKWNAFRKEINSILKDNNINEDKLLGPFFMSEDHLNDHNAVSNKLLLYLKEDVLKHMSNCLFNSQIKSFGDLMDMYEQDASFIFDSKFREKLKKIECDCKFLDKKIEIQENDDNEPKYSHTKEGIIAKEKIVSKLDGSYEKIKNRGCIVFNGKTAHFYQPAFYETPKEKDRIWTWFRKFDVEYDYVIFDARKHGFIQLPKDIVKKVCGFFDKHALWNSKGSGKLMIYLHKDYEKYGTIEYGSKDYNESIDFTKYLKKL